MAFSGIFSPDNSIAHSLSAYNTRSIYIAVSITAALLTGALLLEPLIGFTILGISIAVLVLMVFVRYPRIWLYTIVLLGYVWFPVGRGDDGISLIEFALASFYVGGVLIWIIGMVIIRRQRLVYQAVDYSIIVLFVLMVVHALIAIVSNSAVSPLSTMREFAILCLILYYFPIKHYFHSKQEIVIILTLTVIMLIGIGIGNIRLYLKATSNALYAYQILSSRILLNTNLFMMGTIFALVGALNVRAWKARVGLFTLAVIFGSLVLISFSRGFWLATLASLLLMLLLLDRKRIVSFALYGIAGVILFAGAVYVVAGSKKADVVFKIIKFRFTSSTQGTRDLSLASRANESLVLLNEIAAHPFGNGLGAWFAFYEPIEEKRWSTNFIHNGYLFVLFKLGIPLFVFMHYIWLYYVYKGYQYGRQEESDFYRILAIGAMTSLIAFLIVNLTSSVITQRDGCFCLAWCFAIVAIAEQRMLYTADVQTESAFLPVDAPSVSAQSIHAQSIHAQSNA